jgi:hypothetical protein
MPCCHADAHHVCTCTCIMHMHTYALATCAYAFRRLTRHSHGLKFLWLSHVNACMHARTQLLARTWRPEKNNRQQSCTWAAQCRREGVMLMDLSRQSPSITHHVCSRQETSPVLNICKCPEARPTQTPPCDACISTHCAQHQRV